MKQSTSSLASPDQSGRPDQKEGVGKTSGTGTSSQGAAGSAQPAGAPASGVTAGAGAGGEAVSQPVAVPSGAPQAAAPQVVPEAKKAPDPECFTANFKHKKASGHASNEDCSHHKNRLRLEHENINPAAVCVRVNGRPVAFQQVKGAPKDLLIGSLAGPDSRIQVSYCIGKARCKDDCRIPRDEFMDAIGGNEEESAKAGKWETGDAKRDLAAAQMDLQIKKEMAEFDADEDVFSDWLGDAESTWACQLVKGKAK